MSVITKIGEIRRKLDACISLRNAQDSAARVYDDALILADQAANAVTEAEKVLEDAAAAAEAAIEAKEAALESLKQGAIDLSQIIKNTKIRGSDAPSNQKKSKASSVAGVATDALSACLAVRETVNKVAQKTAELKSVAESAAEVASIANAALNDAESAWTERVRIYEDAKAAAEAAQASMIEAAKILNP